MTVTVKGVTVYSREYEEQKRSAAAEAENNALASMRADMEAERTATEEACRAERIRWEQARALYLNNNVILGLPFTRVPAHLEPMVAIMEEQAEEAALLGDKKRAAGFAQSEDEANKYIGTAEAGRKRYKEVQDSAAAGHAKEAREGFTRFEEQQSKIKATALREADTLAEAAIGGVAPTALDERVEAMPDIVTVQDDTVEMPMVLKWPAYRMPKRQKVSRNREAEAECEEMEDDERMAAIAAVNRCKREERYSGTHDSTARSSSSAI